MGGGGYPVSPEGKTMGRKSGRVTPGHGHDDGGGGMEGGGGCVNVIEFLFCKLKIHSVFVTFPPWLHPVNIWLQTVSA